MALSVDWSEKDYAGPYVVYSDDVAAAKNGLLGGLFSCPTGYGGDRQRFKYYDPGKTGSDIYLNCQIQSWMRVALSPGSSVGYIYSFMFLRLQDLSPGECYFLSLGCVDSSTTRELRLYRDNPQTYYAQGRLLYSEARADNIWYKLRLQAKTNASGNIVIGVYEDTDNNDVWTTLVEYIDANNNKLSGSGFLGFGMGKNRSEHSGQGHFDDVRASYA